MKTCSKCLKEKYENDFYKEKISKDGLQRWCKECSKENLKEYIKNDKYLNSRVLYSQTEKNKNYRREYNSKENVKERLKKWRNSYRNNEIMKNKRYCHSAIQHALEMGYMVRLNCKECNNPISEAHHEDYSKPLEVIWLCKKHHMEFHRLKRRVLCLNAGEFTRMILTSAKLIR